MQRVLKNDLQVGKRVEVVYTFFQMLSDLVAVKTSFLGTVGTGMSGLFLCLFKTSLMWYVIIP